MDQDWTVVVLKPKQKKTVKNKNKDKANGPTELKYNASRNIQKQPTMMARKIEEKADDGDLSLPSVTHNLQIQIQQSRQRKNLTQKQLAHACNLQDGVIKSYENGTALSKTQDLVKMSRVLGVTLKLNN